MNMKEVQNNIWNNKINKGFNTTDVNKNFCLLYGEVSEAHDAYRKQKDDLSEEFADIAIYLIGLSEMLGFNLEDEIIEKVKYMENYKLFCLQSKLPLKGGQNVDCWYREN